MNDFDRIFDLLKEYGLTSNRCPQCCLMGNLKPCPSCGIDACDKCIAVDGSDCISCGPHGDIFKEIKMNKKMKD